MSRRWGLALLGVLVLACYAVPFLLLRDVAAWYGSFLFWVLAGLCVIALNLVITTKFGGRGDE